LPPKSPRIPLLYNGKILKETHQGKAQALAARFFPNITPQGYTPLERTGPRVPISQDMDKFDIAKILWKTSPWKAPGLNNLPMGFLKAYGQPLIKTLARIANASFNVSYFPSAFKQARVVVLRKPGKIMEQL